MKTLIDGFPFQFNIIAKYSIMISLLFEETIMYLKRLLISQLCNMLIHAMVTLTEVLYSLYLVTDPSIAVHSPTSYTSHDVHKACSKHGWFRATLAQK